MDFKDVIAALQWEGLAAEVESEVGEIWHCGAFDGVLSVPLLLGTDLSVDHLRNIGRKSNERSS